MHSSSGLACTSELSTCLERCKSVAAVHLASCACKQVAITEPARELRTSIFLHAPPSRMLDPAGRLWMRPCSVLPC